MKQLTGIIELHGDHVEIRQWNNEISAYIEGVSPYDFEAIILAQSEGWKKDLLKNLLNDLGIDLYTVKDMKKVWDDSKTLTNKVEYFKGRKNKISL
jgi:sensor domain CHASE-containing protein